ncbi:MAG: hypothetical protein ABIJ27_04690 [Candidatus Omnitrophota bacterium]
MIIYIAMIPVLGLLAFATFLIGKAFSGPSGDPEKVKSDLETFKLTSQDEIKKLRDTLTQKDASLIDAMKQIEKMDASIFDLKKELKTADELIEAKSKRLEDARARIKRYEADLKKTEQNEAAAKPKEDVPVAERPVGDASEGENTGVGVEPPDEAPKTRSDAAPEQPKEGSPQSEPPVERGEDTAGSSEEGVSEGRPEPESPVEQEPKREPPSGGFGTVK